MSSIQQGVGLNQPNAEADVRFVQQRLGVHRFWLGNNPVPQVTGTMDDATMRAINAFQEGGAALAKADGVISPRGYTIQALEMATIPWPSHKVFSPQCWAHGAGLTDTDFNTAATALGCEVNAIRAVAKVETKRAPWDEMGRPTILFERHYFRRFTANRYDRSHPDISGSQGAYGKYSAQYPKLTRAATLDHASALKSASWGMFQIMGANHVAAGYSTVEAFVDGMMVSEGKHLAAFVSYINAHPTLKTALKNKAWATFAAGYNGPGYSENNYDVEMQNAYNALVAGR